MTTVTHVTPFRRSAIYYVKKPYAAWLSLSCNLNVDDKIPLKFNNYTSAWKSLQTSLLNTFLDA